jgi:hypothetical protein
MDAQLVVAIVLALAFAITNGIRINDAAVAIATSLRPERRARFRQARMIAKSAQREAASSVVSNGSGGSRFIQLGDRSAGRVQRLRPLDLDQLRHPPARQGLNTISTRIATTMAVAR